MKMHEDELRLMGMAAPQILKLLKTREERVLQRMHATFKAGDEHQISNLAEFATLRDLINDVNSALRQFEQET